MNYRDFFLIESWKNYTVSTNPEILLYDFYVASYLTTLPLDPDQKGFSGTLMGRESNEIKLDIKNAEDKLLPALRDKLSEALFIAICAEVQHIADEDMTKNRENFFEHYKEYKNNQLLKKYLRNYTLFMGDSLPDEFKPTRNVDEPQQEPKQFDYLQSFKSATKAIRDTGSSREQFVRLSAELFRKMRWKALYGGKKWAEIAEAYVLLNKSPQTNAQLQVAIDHAYDLQHNTGTVLNKVKTYYNKNDINWLKKALDFKANLKNVYELLPKCSSDMRKLALEAFKTAGIKKNTLEKTVAGDSISGNKGSDTSEIKTGDSVRFKSNDGNLEIEGIAKEVNKHTVWITITKVIKATSQADDETYKVGNKLGFGSKFVTKINNNDHKLKIGDTVIFKDGESEVEGVITGMSDDSTSNIKVTKVINTTAQQKDFWKKVINVKVDTSYLTKKSSNDSSDKSKQFGVGDFIKYKVDNGTNSIELNGVITKVDGNYDKGAIINITKIITLPQSPTEIAVDWKVGQTVMVYKKYMTKLGEKTTFVDTVGLKKGDVGTLDIQGNIYEVKLLGQASDNSFSVLIVKPIKVNYKQDEVVIGTEVYIGINYLKNSFKSYSDTSEKPKTNDELKVGDVKTLKIYGNTYDIQILGQWKPDNTVIIKIFNIIDNKYPVNVNIGDKMSVDLGFFKNALRGDLHLVGPIKHIKNSSKSYSDTSKEEKFEVGDIVTFVFQNAKYEGVVTQKVTTSTLRVKVQKILDSKDANKNLLLRIGKEVTMGQSFFKKKEYI